MRYVDEFRNSRLIKRFADEIKAITPCEKLNIMEVCGTHTQSFYRFGLDKILPENLRLIAGPGCPVCVSSQGYIDAAIKLCRHKDVIMLTFGDMLRIPGSISTLEKERAVSSNVRVVYSPLDCIRVAKLNPEKNVVFLAVGFETTAPTIALSIISAKKENLKNLSFLCSLKLIPPVMEYLVLDKRLNLSGFLCPGHVSAIIGTRPYEIISRRHKIPCCIAGFEPLDILEGIYLILRQITNKNPKVDNQYARVVKKEGNIRARETMAACFRVTDAFWRGLGKIPESGLKIKNVFAGFDAEKIFSIKQIEPGKRKNQCRCVDILKGLISPQDCPLFAKTCLPDTPIGPCMVTNEGACNAYYKFKRKI
jgi:hydrogenase expression/formation protein HypD